MTKPRAKFVFFPDFATMISNATIAASIATRTKYIVGRITTESRSSRMVRPRMMKNAERPERSSDFTL